MMRGTVFLAGVAVLAVILGPAVLQAEIYVYRDGKGTLHFTNAPNRSGYRRFQMETPVGRAPRWRAPDPEVIRSLNPIIEDAAGRHAVDTSLVKAVIHAESNFVPYAVSPKGALGLMQLMPATARRHGVWRAFDPRENVEGGVKHLRWLLNRYAGNVRLALAAYNAGEGAVDRYGGVPPYQETQEYLRRVLFYRQRYLQHESVRRP